MPSKDEYDITRHANGPNAWDAFMQSKRSASRAVPSKANIDLDGPDLERPDRMTVDRRDGGVASEGSRQCRSRESIIRNYDANAALKAKSLRQHSERAIHDFQEREERSKSRRLQRASDSMRLNASDASLNSLHTPHMSFEQAREQAREARAMNRERNAMTAQESHDRTMMSKENFEAERARRDAFSSRGSSRTSNREVIDGRGSIDSRAFNERQELVGYSIDKTDCPDPLVETPEDAQGKWRSQAGQGFAPTPRTGSFPRHADLNKLSDTISGKSQYRTQGPIASMPISARLLIVLIVVLLAILVYLLFFR